MLYIFMIFGETRKYPVHEYLNTRSPHILRTKVRCTVVCLFVLSVSIQYNEEDHEASRAFSSFHTADGSADGGGDSNI